MKLIPLLASGFLLFGMAPGIARPLVNPVNQSQAQGLSGGGAVIHIWPGSGTNIDFNQTGETIIRAWLDDPSRILVDFDSSIDKAQGTSVVHLRRVNGIRFPNLPQTNSTLLTIITRTPYGNRKTYLFEVRYGAGAPEYASVAILPDNQPLSGGLVLREGKTANWADVERGLQKAISQRLISPSSPVVSRVQSFLAIVRSGVPQHQAIAQSKVPLPVILRLAEMGYGSTPPGATSLIPPAPPLIPTLPSSNPPPTTGTP